MFYNTAKLAIMLVTLLCVVSLVNLAVVHSHSSNLNKEREDDGAYSPRDRGHISHSGEHDNEFDHESILGSAKEAEEYDHLPPEEAKRRLRILLTKMDLNGDEQIDRKELKAWILRSFKMLSKEEAQEHLEDADENGDGRVTWAEYVSDAYGTEESDEALMMDKENEQIITEGLEWLNSWEQCLKDEQIKKDEFLSESTAEGLRVTLLSSLDITKYLISTQGFKYVLTRKCNQDPIEMIQDDKIMWKVADTNADGVLEGDEWIAFSHPEEHPAMLPHILEQTLRDKDTDKDGVISFQEYIGDRGRDRDKEWLHVEKDKFDHELDKDGDGKLTGNEILSWVVPSNEEIADEEVLHLFSVSDDDENDILSFDEVLEHHDTFVGSEATDYGDHLHNIHHFQDEL